MGDGLDGSGSRCNDPGMAWALASCRTVLVRPQRNAPLTGQCSVGAERADMSAPPIERIAPSLPMPFFKDGAGRLLWPAAAAACLAFSSWRRLNSK